jgi:hypothetical protein
VIVVGAVVLRWLLSVALLVQVRSLVLSLGLYYLLVVQSLLVGDAHGLRLGLHRLLLLVVPWG